MSEEKVGLIDRAFDSVDRLLKLEKPGNLNLEEVHSFNDSIGRQIGWIDLHTRESGNFEPLHYSTGFDTRPENLRMIPPANKRYSIHFLPPEAQEAIKKSVEDEPWYLQDDFIEQGGQIRQKYASVMVEFLTLIKQGKFPEMDYIVAGTNPRMAELAFSLGFKRCWQQGRQPFDLTRPIWEDDDVIIGASIQELSGMYDLQHREPTLEAVHDRIRLYARERNSARRAASSGPF